MAPNSIPSFKQVSKPRPHHYTFCSGVNPDTAKMGLLDMPFDVLDGILDLSLPSGIEGLTLSCRAIYERATPQIRRHNKLKQRWRVTNNRWTRHTGDTLQILYEISLDPLIAEYIEVLDLHDWRAGMYFIAPDDPQGGRAHRWTTEIPTTLRNDQGALGSLKTFLDESFQTTQCNVEIDEVWKDIMKGEICSDDDEYDESTWTVVALLSLLPNLTTLRFPAWWKGPEGEAGNALDVLVRAANVMDGRSKPLATLKNILHFMESRYEQKTPLQAMQHIMALSGMRELYLNGAVAVDDGYTGHPFVWAYPEIVASITRMELAACCIDAEGLSALVAHTPNLVVFKYSHETKWHGCQYDWNPGTFAEALARYCGQSLIEVSITLDAMNGCIVNGASSFRSFPKLEKLEIDVDVFCGPSVKSGQRLGSFDDAYIPPGENPWTTGDISSIGSMLPDRIKEVQINTNYEKPDRDALQALLKNLREQRAERLHKLERIIVREFNGPGVEDLVEAAGATLEVLGAELGGRYVRGNVPEWRRRISIRTQALLDGNIV